VPSIGETLREARMRQRLDITDVEAQTKIRAKYLRALENEDFGMLPGPTFVKSFLRTYAEFLGLDPHLLVEEYRARHDPRDESELTQFAPRPPRGRERRRPPRRPAWLPVAAAVVAILAVLLVLGLTGNSSDQSSTTTTSTVSQAAKKKAAEAKRRAEARRRARERRRAARRARTVKLRIVPAAATYVCLDKGVGTPVVYEGTLAAPKSWKAKHLRVNLGRRAVRITVNGKAVKVPPGSDPIGFDFRPTHHTVITGTRPCG
jgi:cytoskeleton protein RodZ